MRLLNILLPMLLISLALPIHAGDLESSNSCGPNLARSLKDLTGTFWDAKTNPPQFLFATIDYLKDLDGDGAKKVEEWNRLLTLYNQRQRNLQGGHLFLSWLTSVSGGHWIAWGPTRGCYVFFHKDGNVSYLRDKVGAWRIPAKGQIYNDPGLLNQIQSSH